MACPRSDDMMVCLCAIGLVRFLSISIILRYYRILTSVHYFSNDFFTFRSFFRISKKRSAPGYQERPIVILVVRRALTMPLRQNSANYPLFHYAAESRARGARFICADDGIPCLRVGAPGYHVEVHIEDNHHTNLTGARRLHGSFGQPCGLF